HPQCIHTFISHYIRTATIAASSSPTLSQAGHRGAVASTSTGVGSSPNPSTVGQSVTLTATVTSGSGTPAGTVQFKDGANNLGSGQALNRSAQPTLSHTAAPPVLRCTTPRCI